MILVIGITFATAATVVAGLAIIARWDEPVRLGKKQWLLILPAAFLESVGILVLFDSRLLWEQLLLAVFAGSLLLACVTDVRFCQVYNFVWWIGGSAALSLLGRKIFCAEGRFALCIIIRDLLVFCGLQLLLFRRMYGRADCYAFLGCAVVETWQGMGLTGYLWHMLFAYGLLGFVQGLKGNIAGNGNLKTPVPFLPYITLSFWGILLCCEILCTF